MEPPIIPMPDVPLPSLGHLRRLSVTLAVIVAALITALTAVRMNATVSGTGLVTSPDLLELRARQSGILTLEPGMEPGTTHDSVPFARLGGQSLVLPSLGAGKWLVVETPVASGESVAIGQVVLKVVPVDGTEDKPRRQGVRLEVGESQVGDVAVGQSVRLASQMWPPRVHGYAMGVVARLEPMGLEGERNARKFVVHVDVSSSPFALRLGSGVRGEIVTGRKPAWQIILEH